MLRKRVHQLLAVMGLLTVLAPSAVAPYHADTVSPPPFLAVALGAVLGLIAVAVVALRRRA